jgi:hypothetical protein
MVIGSNAPQGNEKGEDMHRPSLGPVLILIGLASSARGDDRPAEPIRPRDDVIRLFNGRDLTGLSTWLKDTKRADPREVFTARDGLLRISGDGLGYVGTDRAYRDYHLIVEYKWGDRTDGGRSVRNSGILLHANGPDGGAGGGAWMSSIECQLAQGCVGDLIVIRGRDERGAAIPVRLTGDVVMGPDRRPRWRPGGEPRVFTDRQLWWSRHDPDFKELIDTRGREDVESPLGEWTRVECLCAGDRIKVIVNGIAVNACYRVFPTAGRILLQSEGFELLVRRFELRPLQPAGDRP